MRIRLVVRDPRKPGEPMELPAELAQQVAAIGDICIPRGCDATKFLEFFGLAYRYLNGLCDLWDENVTVYLRAEDDGAAAGADLTPYGGNEGNGSNEGNDRKALTGEPSALIVEIVIEPRLGEEPPR